MFGVGNDGRRSETLEAAPEYGCGLGLREMAGV
jgi:hypothetical protein